MIYLVDVAHITFPMYYGLPKMVRPSDGHPVGAVHGVCQYFWRLAQERPEHVAVVYDAPGGSRWRKEVFPEYKANRKPLPDDLTCQFPLVRRAADVFGFARVELAGHESDDIVATYCKLARQRDHEVVVVSSDKDLMQLVCWSDGLSPAVSMYDPKKQLTITPDQVKERWGVAPELMAQLLALMGDASDNVPGVDNIGPKYAAALLQQFGSVEAALDGVEQVQRNATKLALQKNGWKARISLRLTALKDDIPVEQDVSEFAYPGVDRDKVLEFLDEMELVTLREEITGVSVAA